MSEKPDKAKNVDEYIERAEVAIRPFLVELRATIREAVPDALEKLAWGMPSYWKYKYVIHFDAYRDHVNVYIGAELTEKCKQLYPEFSYTGRGIQLYYDQPIPHELIRTVARESYQREVERKNANSGR